MVQPIRVAVEVFEPGPPFSMRFVGLGDAHSVLFEHLACSFDILRAENNPGVFADPFGFFAET